MRRVLPLAMALAAAMSFPAMAQQAPVPREIAYGGDGLQTLDVYPAQGVSGPAPLVVFVHGGGWRRGDKASATGADKIAHFTGKGFAFATINYRLVPDARVEEQAQDVADALARLVRDARALGIDASRIVLIGHSAGAHLAALVGTDPRYLRQAGLRLDQIDGVVLLDGAAYDVPAQRREGAPIMQKVYAQVFGDAPARQRALSPTFQAAAPNAPAFLLLHVQREDGKRQAEALAAALRAAGTQATVGGLPGRNLRGHMAINRELGDPGYPGTAIVDDWIAATLRGGR